MIPPEVLLLYRIDCFGYPGFFGFLYEVEYSSFEVCEEFCWDFDGHWIESVDCFFLNHW